MGKIKRKGKRSKASNAIKGALRRAHFASGGSLVEWLGLHATHHNRDRALVKGSSRKVKHKKRR